MPSEGWNDVVCSVYVEANIRDTTPDVTAAWPVVYFSFCLALNLTGFCKGLYRILVRLSGV